MDGYDVLNKLNNADNLDNIQEVAIMGDIVHKDIQKGLDSGFLEYLTKPVRIQMLVEFADKAFQKVYN